MIKGTKLTASGKEAYQSFMEEIPSSFRIHADKSIVNLPQSVGSGFARKVRLEEGLTARNLNFKLRSEFEFFRLARKPLEEKTFQLYYFLDNTRFNFIYDEASAKLPPNAFTNILFLSNDFSVHGTFNKWDNVKILVLTFSISWLTKNGYTAFETCKPFVNTEKAPDEGMLFMTPPGSLDYKLALEIFESLAPTNDFLFPTRVKALQLIESFFQKMNNAETERHNQLSGYYLQMLRLEKKIQEYLHSHLPNIKDLAREFNMSESNVKRHFASVYHKNIYEYYLEKKMHLSMDMLQREGLTVSEVASKLGYEKLASFSNAFKNLFGYLPSELKKKQKRL